MRALVVYETMFGNTRKIAEAIADGMRDSAHVDLVEVTDAPDDISDAVDLLVVGGPTHAFSMSRYSTRQEAAHRGGRVADLPRGIRDWLSDLPSGESKPIFVAFDTRVDMPLMPGAASRSATRAARRKGFTHTAAPESFLVEGYEGPLVDGELDRARQWGHSLTAGPAD
ncbi:flavodoxin family protein [Microbacterium sp. Re1]|uniref:Flavodoxin family protein n=1 Tax=Microbacterium commune TaxID=2762219 RepID=A0ABR8W7S6_9MICO|nr:flavodoxin domain-containing protein [Microbacterium commune]MBD8013051.1 flavodoxin family protein [Microbacterium commune]